MNARLMPIAALNRPDALEKRPHDRIESEMSSYVGIPRRDPGAGCGAGTMARLVRAGIAGDCMARHRMR
jgi:hypothetical protein